MKPRTIRISFIRSVMAGLLTGIIAAIACIIFVFVYRSFSGVNAYNFLISPVFIFVGVPLILTLSGILLFILARYVTRGLTWFSTLFILLTIFCIVASISFRQGDRTEGTNGLLIGLEIVIGLAAAWLLPYLARHPALFMTKLGQDASS